MTPDQPVLDALLAREQPDASAARAFMDAVMDGALDERRVAAVLTAFHFVGVTSSTLAAFARSIRAHMVAVPADGPLLDTCGTGGSGLDTANTSTMAAFVVAACGVRVAKHGNRSSSGRCGSSDLLEGLGVPLRLAPDHAARLLDDVGLAFLFAPAYHPAFRHVGPVRKALGFRTVFNLLGPLCNPAGATHQLLGVSDPTTAPLLAAALQELGSEAVLVVHGEDGLDEVSLAAPTRCFGHPTVERIDPVALGLEPATPASLRGGDVARNVAIFHEVMAGRDTPHARLVRLNAAAALVVAGRANTFEAALELASDALSSGAALARFEAYRTGVQHG